MLFANVVNVEHNMQQHATSIMSSVSLRERVQHTTCIKLLQKYPFSSPLNDFMYVCRTEPKAAT